jgi:hypothetical protein
MICGLLVGVGMVGCPREDGWVVCKGVAIQTFVGVDDDAGERILQVVAISSS